MSFLVPLQEDLAYIGEEGVVCVTVDEGIDERLRKPSTELDSSWRADVGLISDSKVSDSDGE